MPRAKKKTRKEINSYLTGKSTVRRVIHPGDTFWTKVINGMKKILSPKY